MLARVKIAAAASAAVFVVFTAWIALGWGGEYATLVFDDLALAVVPLSAAWACQAASRRAPVQQRRGWLLIGLSAAAWGLGQSAWSYYEIVRRDEVPFPSAADVGFLGAVPFAVAGLLALSTRPAAGERWKSLLDGLLIGLSTLIVGWVVVLSPVYGAGMGTPLQNTLALAYPSADVAVMAFVLYGFFQAPRIGPAPLVLLGFGFLAWAVADGGFALLTATQSYATGAWIDAGWLAGFLLIGLAAQVATAQLPAERAPRPLHPAVRFLPVMAVALAAVAAAAQQLRTGRVDAVVFWLGILAIAVLVLRQAMALVQVAAVGKQASLAAAELAVANRQLAAAQAMSGLGSWEWNAKTGALTWSEQLYRIFQVDPATRLDLAGYLKLVHPSDRAKVQKAIEDGQATGEPFEFQHRLPREGGHDRVLHCRGTVALDAQGNVETMFGTAQDVTEVALASQVDELRRQEDFKRSFMNSAAHELRTPLTPIRLQTHIIRAEAHKRGDAVTRRAAEVLERNATRLQEIVEDVLEATRLQSGHLSLRSAPNDVAVALRQAIASYADTLQALGFRLEDHIQAPLVADVDLPRVEQVFNQLLGNAIKFSPAGGRIIVWAEKSKGLVRVSVQDEGIGIRPKDLGRIFQPFVQVHDDPVTEKGTGLGLFVARGIVEAHGGRIWADSQLGQGTSVFIEIPEHGPAGAKAAAAQDKSYDLLPPQPAPAMETDFARRMRELI